MITQQQLQDSLTIPQFVAWLETKPPETTFDYVDNGDCPIARYVRERFGIDAADITVGPSHVTLLFDVWIEAVIPEKMDAAVHDRSTYAAVLEALR